MKAIIRIYKSQDLSKVVQLWYKTWHSSFPDIQHPQPYRLWEKRFRDELVCRGEVWVADVKYQVVGFIVVFRTDNSKNTGELNQIFVDPIFQNKGIGTLLLNKAKTICPQGLKLTALQTNKKACCFYTKHGFVPGEMSINKINQQPNIEYIWRPLGTNVYKSSMS
ncbi:GNAT family N-acetyltransferase [Mastigocoleus sp. MO_188.B34]|uniref:GNAT family N-acetyltransferase n=1 Tax=Mastigocoleus sp. MO_188.B34 TaxID=3036635 RepID=UPI0026024270|nr:GNAT family N-acetyltransferase [Mastigocoleus sp. MO_188.B34]MDJ0698012.1 GNAT family N-acetyltransferase [Mastigocoleus sp. MO_188.B34]